MILAISLLSVSTFVTSHIPSFCDTFPTTRDLHNLIRIFLAKCFLRYLHQLCNIRYKKIHFPLMKYFCLKHNTFHCIPLFWLIILLVLTTSSVPPQYSPLFPVSSMPSYMPTIFYTVRPQGCESASIS